MGCRPSRTNVSRRAPAFLVSRRWHLRPGPNTNDGSFLTCRLCHLQPRPRSLIRMLRKTMTMTSSAWTLVMIFLRVVHRGLSYEHANAAKHPTDGETVKWGRWRKWNAGNKRTDDDNDDNVYVTFHGSRRALTARLKLYGTIKLRDTSQFEDSCKYFLHLHKQRLTFPQYS